MTYEEYCHNFIILQIYDDGTLEDESKLKKYFKDSVVYKNEWIKIHSEVKVEDKMIEKIYSTFNVGEKYGKASIKSILKNIYTEFEYPNTAKASDLSDYYVLKNTKAQENGKWVHGFEILGKK